MTIARITAAATAVALTAFAAQGEEKIGYATHIPSTNVTVEPAVNPWIETLSEATGGELEVEVYWGGSVAKHGAILTALRDGLADMGLLADLYAANDLPNSVLITNMPLLSLDSRVMSAVAAEARLLGCEGCEEELEEYGIKLYNAYALPSQYLICREPVADLAALQGKKVRVTGVLGRMLAKWGATPVAMPVTDAYEALERGQVDCSTGIETFFMDYSWWDSAKYVLDLPLGGFAGVLNLISDYKLENLSDESRAAMMETRASMAAASAYAYYDASSTAREMGIADHGVEYLAPADDIKSALAEAQAAERDEALAQGEKRGAQDPQARIDNAVALMEKWTAILDEIGDDKDAYAQALEREIYSKVSY